MGLKAAAAAVGFAVALVLLYQAGRWLETRNANPEARGDLSQRPVQGETIEVDGVAYRQRTGLTTVLLMGIDRDADVEPSGSRNGGQADFLRLLVIDANSETVTQVAIDRDTMTPITTLGVLGTGRACGRRR